MSTGRKQRFSKDLTRKKIENTITYAEYGSLSESQAAMGYGNGGEADKWQASLTKSEESAVKYYTGSGFTNLNDALRYGGTMTTYEKNKDKYLEQALNKFNLEKPTTFTRGSTADLLGGASTVTEINAMKGQLVVDKGYTSSAVSANKGFTWKPIIYHINTPAGKGIGAYVSGKSAVGVGEDEFLFNKRSAFVVKGAYEEGGKVHCNIDYYGRVK